MTREQRIGHYMMNNRRNLAELMVRREDEYEETLKTQHDLMVSGEKRGVDKATEDFNSRTCDNCKSFTEGKDISHLCTMGNSCGIDEYGIPTVLRTWGCNEFERKEDD